MLPGLHIEQVALLELLDTHRLVSVDAQRHMRNAVDVKREAARGVYPLLVLRLEEPRRSARLGWPKHALEDRGRQLLAGRDRECSPVAAEMDGDPSGSRGAS